MPLSHYVGLVELVPYSGRILDQAQVPLPLVSISPPHQVVLVAVSPVLGEIHVVILYTGLIYMDNLVLLEGVSLRSM